MPDQQRRQFLVVVAVLVGSVTGAAIADTTARQYADYRIIRIVPQTQAQLDAIEQSGVTILNCVPGAGPIEALATTAQVEALAGLGFELTLIEDDVDALVAAERAQPAARVDPFADFFLSYHEYDGDDSIVWYLNELAARYPSLVTVFSMGTTLEGRTIWGVRVTSDATTDKPAVLYFGCEHAREWITTTIPTYFATYLVDNYGTDPVVTDLVDNVEFYLVPVFNVDGYVYSWTPGNRYWRKNRRNNDDGTFGVDLNRNWGTGWGGPGSSSLSSSEIYRGPAPFSEPETQAMRDFFLSHSSINAQLDIHSYGQLILWPNGYTSTLPVDAYEYDVIGSSMQSLIASVHGKWYEAGPSYDTIYPASGASTDWTYEALDILSYSYECRPLSSSPGFNLPPSEIVPNNEELMAAILRMTNTDWVRSPIRFQFPDGLADEVPEGESLTLPFNLIGREQFPVAGSARVHYRFNANEPFVVAPVTDLGGDSYEAVLPATECTDRPEFYLSVDADDGSTVESPLAGPAEPYAVDVASGVFAPLAEEPLSIDPQWVTEGDWQWGPPTGRGWGDPNFAHTGDNVYGYNLDGDYPDNLPATYLITRPFDCSGRTGCRLRFYRWLAVESSSSFDEATVAVSNDGTSWKVIWRATDTGVNIRDDAWQFQELDISAIADNQPTVYVRWGMGPTDEAVTYGGWNIDDVSIAYQTCAGPSTPAPVGPLKNRYISFEPVAGAGAVALRVELVDSAYFPDSLGVLGWVGAPDANGVSRVVDTRVDRVWSEPVIHVGDCEIGPVATYYVRAIPEGLPETDPANFEGPAVFYTARKPGALAWGDCVGAFDGQWPGPDGVLNFTDVSATIRTFQGLMSSPAITSVDVHGDDTGDATYDPPNYVVNFADVQQLILAFQGGAYPFADPAMCP